MCSLNTSSFMSEFMVLSVSLQGVLAMSPDVLHSSVLHQFLTQTLMDREDEEFNKRITECQQSV